MLTKKEVETLMLTYDADPVGSLCNTISALLGVPATTWTQLLALLPPAFAESKELMNQDVTALDELVKQLVEQRTL
jgi:hypothetical protein